MESTNEELFIVAAKCLIGVRSLRKAAEARGSKVVPVEAIPCDYIGMDVCVAGGAVEKARGANLLHIHYYKPVGSLPSLGRNLSEVG